MKSSVTDTVDDPPSTQRSDEPVCLIGDSGEQATNLDVCMTLVRNTAQPWVEKKCSKDHGKQLRKLDEIVDFCRSVMSRALPDHLIRDYTVELQFGKNTKTKEKQDDDKQEEVSDLPVGKSGDHPENSIVRFRELWRVFEAEDEKKKGSIYSMRRPAEFSGLWVREAQKEATRLARTTSLMPAEWVGKTSAYQPALIRGSAAVWWKWAVVAGILGLLIGTAVTVVVYDVKGFWIHSDPPGWPEYGVLTITFALFFYCLRDLLYAPTFRFGRRVLTRAKGEVAASVSGVNLHKFTLKSFDMVVHGLMMPLMAHLVLRDDPWYHPWPSHDPDGSKCAYAWTLQPHSVTMSPFFKLYFLSTIGYRLGEVCWHYVRDGYRVVFSDTTVHHYIAFFMLSSGYLRSYAYMVASADIMAAISVPVYFLPVVLNMLKQDVLVVITLPIAIVAFAITRLWWLNVAFYNVIVVILGRVAENPSFWGVYDIVFFLFPFFIVAVMQFFWFYLYCSYQWMIVRMGYDATMKKDDDRAKKGEDGASSLT